ncbi:SLBB domain-containing protein [Belnapia moabensis]|uniref:SLBB domain-containing protein n=1 Tax=Belnapia moabensis TaxID=365533 RepID=UPI0006937396|nr:SLBB domain-containing protein [Belnapia moabensis]
MLCRLLAAVLVLPWPALGQIAAAGSGFLAPPALPGTLPGGMPLPGLPPGAQQDILQRILDAGAQRPLGQAMPPAPPVPAAPTPVTPAPPLEEPLSSAEAFFASRGAQGEALPGGPAPSPLRLFGIESLRTAPGAPAPVHGFGTLPDDYLIGRDDEVVLAFRGRTRQTLSLRIGRDGMLLLPDLAPIPAAGRTLRDLRTDLSGRAARELGGSEVFLSIGQIRQANLFVGGEVLRPGLQQLTAMASVLDALMASGGIRRTGSLRAIRVEGPASGRRTIDLYPILAGEGDAPDLRLHEGERILVPPLGGVVAIGGEVMRPGLYELPAGAAQAPLAVMLRLAGDPMRPSGHRFLLQTTDAEGRRSWREIGPRDALRRGDALLVQPGSDVLAQQIRLSGHVGAPLVRAATGRGQTLRGLLSDPRLVRPDPYPRLGLVWRTDARTRARRFIPFDLGRVLEGRADMPLAEGDEVVLLGLPDVLFLAGPSVQQALRGDPPAPSTPPTPTPLPNAAGMPGTALAAATPAALPPVPAPATPDCQALVLLTVAAQASPQRFAHARSAGFPDFGRGPCPQVFLDYPTLLPVLMDQTVLLTGEVRLPGLYPILNDTGLDAVLAAAGGATDTADLSGIR